ncbi:molybdate ABC transporter substrate-binding protein [Clostridium estertheticum]|uniref:molybdate ABC transporter substrate-binding protein n=1 Tax=Clostridium estertheticum TaxID=238834 RepID=UPI001C6EBAA4|nr:molybdate ABC transporter substrate-binding protein [Clostridium estertheticum]MBW9153318.1 molybdate ABC transporter substrate-binding protein [Clostridium estertheticum]WLC83067.1 molybdate ABC transporter substrate-binding protein [Clostridium estertheticum]
MKKRVRFVLTMFLVTFTLAMTGCGQKAKTAETPAKATAQKSVTLTISAAASLTEAMGEIKTLYKKEKPNVTINYNFGSSGILQQQIEQGANADLFFSAATKQMTALEKKGLLIDSTKVNLLGNTVVLITKNDSTASIKEFKDLKNSNNKKIALGEPKTVPVGQYSEEILTSLKILDKVKAKAVYAKDVKEVLSWVESGDADAGIVYGSDAKTSKKVKVIAVAGKELYKKPVVYPVAVIKASKNIDDTKEFLKYLSSDKAKAVFVKYGFSFLVK